MPPEPLELQLITIGCIRAAEPKFVPTTLLTFPYSSASSSSLASFPSFTMRSYSVQSQMRCISDWSKYERTVTLGVSWGRD